MGAQHHRHLAERVLALGHRGNRVLPQLGLDAGCGTDRAENRVHRTVAGGLAHLPPGTSAGGANAERFAGATLVKAFNTYTARFQATVGNGEHGHPVAMFLSGQDADAKQITQSLVQDAGFEPVDLGGLREMPLMEAPRRDGAVYGEAYSPDAARRIARAASTDLAEAARLATLRREVDPQEADRP